MYQIIAAMHLRPGMVVLFPKGKVRTVMGWTDTWSGVAITWSNGWVTTHSYAENFRVSDS